MSKDNRQVTGKVKKKLQVINVDKYKEYSQEGKELFEETRNAMLEIFPLENETFHELSVLYAENYAFTLTDKLLSIIDKRLEVFKTEIEKELSVIKATQSTNTVN